MLHSKKHCKNCDKITWHRSDSINPIHFDGPPLWFVYYCWNCGKSRCCSSGLMENAAETMVASGEITEEEAGRRLAMVLPPKVIEETYES